MNISNIYTCTEVDFCKENFVCLIILGDQDDAEGCREVVRTCSILKEAAALSCCCLAGTWVQGGQIFQSPKDYLVVCVYVCVCVCVITNFLNIGN